MKLFRFVIILFFLSSLFVASAQKANAATFTSTQSGDWNLGATWGNSGNNVEGSGYPGPSDTAQVTTTHVVTVTANQTVSAFTFLGASTAGVLEVDSGVVLTVTNAVTMTSADANRAGTIRDGTGAGTITAGSVVVGTSVTPTATTRTTTLTSTISTFTISGTVTVIATNGTGSRKNNGSFNVASGNMSIAGVTTLTPSVNGTATFTLATGAQSAYLTLSNAAPFSGSGTFTPNGTGATVEYTAASPALKVVAYRNLTVSGSGTPTGAVLTINGNLTVSGSVTWTTVATTIAGDLTVGGTAALTMGAAVTGIDNLTIGSGSSLTTGAFNFTVTLATSLSGTLTHGSTTGTKTHTGLVTINSGGTWTNSVNEAVTFSGGLTNNSANSHTFGTGVQSFTVNTQNIGGSNALSIASVTTGTAGVTVTNTGTLIIATALAGGGNFTNGAGATLQLGFSAVTMTGTLTASATGNTVEYNRANTQTVERSILASSTYYNLILSNTSAKTAETGGGITVLGDFTLSGSATYVMGSVTHTFNGNWTIDTSAGTPFTCTTTGGVIFATPGSPAGTSIGGATSATLAFCDVNITNTSGVTFNENASFSTGTTPTLTVDAGATLTPAAGVVISGTGTLTGSGTVQVTKTAGTNDLSTQYSITTRTLTALTVDYTIVNAGINNVTYGGSGNGGLNLSGGITTGTKDAVVAGTLTISNGFTPSGGTITMNDGGVISVTGGTATFNNLTIASAATVTVSNGTFTVGSTFTANATSTVNYTDDTAQAVPGLTYVNIGVGTTADSNGVTYTLGANTTVSGVLTVGNAASTAVDTLAGSSRTINLTGSGVPFVITTTWGAFSAGTSTVNYNNDGGATTIAQATYYNLSVTTTTAKVATFTGGGTYAVATNGSLTFTGTTGNLLTLQSSDSSDWDLEVSNTGTTVTVLYVDVSHSNAAGFKQIDADDGTSVNGGNNTNWLLPAAPTPTPTPVPAAGAPLAYWKFDDAQGTSVANSTTTGAINGTTDGIWKTQDQCVSGMCLLFNGTSQEVTAPYSSALDNTNFTLSTWVSWAGVPTGSEDDTIVERGESSTDNYNYYFFYDADGSSAGSPSLGIGFSDASGNYYEHYYPFIPSTNTWYHIVTTMDDTNNTIKLFVNGRQVLSEAETASPNILGSQTISIARNVAGDSYSYLKGFVDEYKIYNFVLSEQEVKTNFNARSNPRGASLQTANNQNIPGALSNALVGYWKMDESSWTVNCSTGSILDSSGNGLNGAACPNSTGPSGGAVGKFGNGGLLDGAGDSVQVADNNLLDDTATQNKTWSMWVKRTGNAQFNNSAFLIGKQNIGGTAGYNIAIGAQAGNCDPSGTNDNKICFNMDDGTNTYKLNTTAATITADSLWHHVVVVLDRSSEDNTNIYIDGVKTAVTRTGTFSSVGNISNATSMCLGGDISGTGCRTDGLYSFNGTLDESRIYTRALSASDISQLYNWAPGPVGYWQMNEGSWTNDCATASVLDASGNGINGVACPNSTGPIGGAVGKFGKAGVFDGTNDYVTVTSPKLNIATNMTIAAWIYPRNIASNQYNNIYSAGSSAVFEVLDDAGRTNALTLYSAGFGSIDSPDNAITLNTWQHVAAVIENGTARLYVNGVLVASGSFTLYGSGGNTFYIASYDGAQEMYNGLLDEVKVYNYPRTTAQIVEDMNAMQPAPGGSAIGGNSSPVGYWKFNEGYSTVANSSGSCGANCVGTLTGMSSPATATSGWTNNGKFDKALSFDGSNDYVTMGSNDIFAVNGPFTISAWVNPTSFSGNTTANAILGRYDDASSRRNYLLYTDASGQLLFQTSTNASCASGGTVTLPSGKNLSTGIWSHVAGVYDGTYMHTYINGKEVGTPVAQSSICTAATSFAVGVRYGGGSVATSSVFSGRIDDPKFYRQALTSNQIKIDYNRGASQVVGALSDKSTYEPQAANQEYCVPGDTTSCNAPVGLWKFDLSAATQFQDTSGNNLGGTAGGDGNATRGIGKFGKGVYFPDANEYIPVADNPVLRPGNGSWTAQVWAKPSNTNQSVTLLRKFNQATSEGFAMSICGNNACSGAGQLLVAGYAESGSILRIAVSTADIADGNWHLYTMVADKVADTVYLYVDGIKIATTLTSVGVWPTIDDTSEFRISSDTASTFIGPMDDVRLYNYARTPAQVAFDYNKGGPAGYWKFDECQGTTINDSTGNSLTGTLTNATPGTCTTSGSWFDGVVGKRNYSLDFDGTNDYVTISDNDKLDLITGTMTAWVKRDATGSWDSIMAKANGSAASARNYSLEFDTSNRIECGVGNGATGQQALSTATFTDTTNWHLVTCTWDGSTIRIYYDGTERYSVAQTVAGAGNSAALLIGAYDSSSPTDFINAKIDDAQVYAYPMTPTQIKVRYNQGASNFGPVTGAP